MADCDFDLDGHCAGISNRQLRYRIMNRTRETYLKPLAPVTFRIATITQVAPETRRRPAAYAIHYFVFKGRRKRTEHTVVLGEPDIAIFKTGIARIEEALR